jgi:thiamine biosynthesis lipoprotein
MNTRPARLLAAAAAAFLLAAAHASAAEPLTRTEYVLWTQCSVTLFDHTDPAILDAVFQRLHELDSHLSVNVAGSELDAVSDAAGRTPVRVGDDVFSIITRGLHLADLSGGLFDPTVGPLMKVWKMNSEEARIPAPAELARARALVSWRDVVMDASGRTIFLTKPGMRLDAGGLLKGYAGEEVVRILHERGVRSAMVDLGGNISAVGARTDGSPWRIGIQNPDAPRGTTMGIVDVVEKSVVSSGIYEHYFVQNGRKYHHIMDTRTGFPVDNGLTQVTVISSSSFDADSYDTTLFVLGPVAGLKLATSLGIDTIMVTEDHRIFATDAARKMLQLTDTTFSFGQPK